MEEIETYLEWRWKRYNHKKYYKYYDTWRKGITENQFIQIGNQRKTDINYVRKNKNT